LKNGEARKPSMAESPKNSAEAEFFINLSDAETFAVTRFTWANAISAIRLLLIAPVAYAISQRLWHAAAALFVIAVVTDVADGAVARRRGEVTAFGGLLDHGSDALFVTVALAALALNALVPPLLPPLVIGAFAQYVWDSRALAGAPLRASALGRWNGIGYFALAGTVIVTQALEMAWPPPAAWQIVGQLLVVTTLLSMLDRGYTLWRLRRR
jgi:phosphatidylglycerophosphate synthase